MGTPRGRGRSPGRPDRRHRGASPEARRQGGGTAPPQLPRSVVAEIRQVARGRRAEDAIARLDAAVRHLERGQPGRAIREAEEAKALAPRSGGVREVLGLAYYGAGRYRDALKEVQAYRRMTGRKDQNHIAADCYRALGEPAKAIPLAKEALAARAPAPARTEAAVVGASALADLGRMDEALAMIRRVTGKGEAVREHDLRAWYVLADLLERSGRRREAREAFTEIVRFDPQAFDAAERLAQLEA